MVGEAKRARFGLPAAQLKQFTDSTGPLWSEGKLAGRRRWRMR